MEKAITFEETKEIVSTNNLNQALNLNSTNAEQIKNNLEQLKQIALMIKEKLVDGVDYGIVPGTEKPTLFKSGAETINLLFGFRQIYTLIERTNQQNSKQTGIISYFWKVELLNQANLKIAEGFGLCSSQEKSKETQNPFHIENTIMKVAKKRALVDATISLGVLSEIFTQDMEDHPLATTSQQSQELAKFDGIALYSLAYDNFTELKSLFLEIVEKEQEKLIEATIKKDKAKVKFTTKQKQAEAYELYKGFIKEFISLIWLKHIGIDKKSFQRFTKDDKQFFLKHINKDENKIKDMEIAIKFYETKYKK